MMPRWTLLLALCCSVAAAGLRAGEPASGARELTLGSPLTTVLPIPGALGAAGTRIEADIEVPEDAPPELGVGAYAVDGSGHWFQRCGDSALAAGRHHLTFALGPDDILIAEPERSAWTPSACALTERVGLFFWSPGRSQARLRILGTRLVPLPPRSASSGPPASRRLDDCHIDGMDAAAGCARGITGARWTVSVRPVPFPRNPYAPDEFALDALITTPDGRELRIPAFAQQPLAFVDRGDLEAAHRTAPLRFDLRFRPALPGHYRVRLSSTWGGTTPLISELPPLEITGPPRDEIVRVDAADPRFFSVAGRMFWPIGLNLHSVYDLRSCDQLGTVATPDRGWFAYAPRLDRFAAMGGTAVEIWMSNWNLGLEWRPDRPGFAGLGRYHEANAARLDAILDRAWADGIRVNLVIQNHGQASIQINSDWKSNPYNRANGGPLDYAAEIFTHPAALAGQERLRRYLVARYADHPAILGWKLWSEVNLTAGANQRGLRPPDDAPAEDGSGHDALRRWHEQASARWHELDVYHHPVCTHFSGDYRRVYPDIAALPGIDYVCFNAYHRAPRQGRYALTLAELLSAGLLDRETGLGRFAKPMLVTEYVGTSSAAAEPLMRCEHDSGPWLALVTGHAGSPMSWWFEWIEQHGHWGAYGAISRFIAGEDLRGATARSASLAAESAAGPLWARIWLKPGHALGYVIDQRWAANGEQMALHDQATVRIGDNVPAGRCRMEWWDADSGTILRTVEIDHPGGGLVFQAPPFHRHLGFKLGRIEASPTQPL